MKKVLQSLLVICLIILAGGCSNKEDDGATNVKASTLETTYLEKPTRGKPKAQDPLDNIFIALNILKQADYYESESSGEVEAKKSIKLATQTVESGRTITPNATYAYSKSISTFAKVAEQLYITEDTVLKREANKVSSSNISWKNSATSMTTEQYLSQYGYSSSDPIRYVINKETITSDIEIINNGIGRKYTYKFSLDPKLATYNYATNIKNLVNAKSTPNFKSVEVTMTFDYKWRMTRIETYEVYDLQLNGIGKVTCYGSLTETFKNIDKKIAISEESFFKKYL